MATTQDLCDDLSVGMTEVRRTLEHYNLGAWREYLVVRQPGEPDSFVILAPPGDKSGFAARLEEFHHVEAMKERGNEQ